MEENIQIFGATGKTPFDEIVQFYLSKGGDVILLNPDFVYCKEQVISSIQHAKRSFENKTNRSKTLLTEIIMYVSGERQVSKALSKMKPIDENFIVVLFNIKNPDIEKIGLVLNEKLLKPDENKAKKMGLNKNGLNISYEQLALELVAMLDIEKV